MRIGCAVDRLEESVIEGWILDRDDPDQRLELDILLGDPPEERPLGGCVADLFRADLLKAGLGDGACGFRFEMPPLPPHLLGLVRLRLSGSDLFLRPPRARPGLWTDRHDWLETMGRRHRDGGLAPPVSALLFRFQRDGWLSLPGALSWRALHRLRAGLRRSWLRPPPGLEAETFEPDGHLRRRAPDPALEAGRTMLVDPHRHLPACADVLAAPEAAGLLEALLDGAPAIARSRAGRLPPGLPMQKDTATVPASPGWLACRLALEDVEGGIVLLGGSHRAPPFLFGGVRAIGGAVDRHDECLARIEADAEASGHRRDAPRLRAGDLLLHHPDLAHGAAAGDGPLPATLSLHVARRDMPPAS